MSLIKNANKTSIWFDENLWAIVKEFAGYSNNWPIDLPYYMRMLGLKKNYCITKIKWKRLNSLEDYIDKICEITDSYEEDLEFAFIPKRPPKSMEQMKKEWEERNGVGSWSDDDDYF